MSTSGGLLGVGGGVGKNVCQGTTLLGSTISNPTCLSRWKFSFPKEHFIKRFRLKYVETLRDSRKTSDFFENLRKWSCRLQKSRHSQDKTLTSISLKKLAIYTNTTHRFQLFHLSSKQVENVDQTNQSKTIINFQDIVKR